MSDGTEGNDMHDMRCQHVYIHGPIRIFGSSSSRYIHSLTSTVLSDNLLHHSLIIPKLKTLPIIRRAIRTGRPCRANTRARIRLPSALAILCHNLGRR